MTNGCGSPDTGTRELETSVRRIGSYFGVSQVCSSHRMPLLESRARKKDSRSRIKGGDIMEALRLHTTCRTELVDYFRQFRFVDNPQALK